MTTESDVPHAGRVYNYWLGGTYNGPVDRAAADEWREHNPGVVATAQQSRRFLIRVARVLAREAGMRQFLDVGAGFPLEPGLNLHEVVQVEAADARVVYVDDDPLVTEAQARTAPAGVTAVEADLHEPEAVLDAAGAALDLNEPVAVLFMGVLGHTFDPEETYEIVRATMAPLASGSHLVVWDDVPDEGKLKASEAYEDTGAVGYYQRTPEQIRACLPDGYELVEPGLVAITDWRPDADVVESVGAHGAVARKP